MLLHWFCLRLQLFGFVVRMERGQRRITSQYAQASSRVRQAYSGSNKPFAIKVNMAGVIPSIFASSILFFLPPLPNGLVKQ